MWEAIAPAAAYVFASTITPGPSNLMLAASGRQFGYRRSLPHLAGIACGFTSLLVLAALGLGALISQSPGLGFVLKLFASGYLLYLLWRILSSQVAEGQDAGHPLTLWQTALFQFVNPKVWMMAVSSVAIAGHYTQSVLITIALLASAFLTVGIACNHIWLLSGMSARRLLASKRGRYSFNSAIALLTAYALQSMWMLSDAQ